MTVALTTTQIAERLTVTLTVASAASLPSAIIVVDGKAYQGTWTPAFSSFTYDAILERGPHTIYAQVTDSVGTVTMAPVTYVMAYELSEYGIDVYSGDARLDVIEPLLHDALLPDLPTLNFSCSTLLTGTIEVVIRERGLRKYQFTIDTVSISGPLYVYTCLAAESYALTTSIMALQTAYGPTSDALGVIAPSLNIVNAELLTRTTYPQLFANITPLEVIKQLMIQALAQASVRNGNLYAFPLDVGGKKVTFSADIKSAVAGNVQFYSLGKYEINTSVGVAATTTYQRVTMTGYFSHNPQGYNGDVCRLSFYGGYGSGIIPTVRNVEILVDGVQVLVSATEFTGSPSEYCMKDITAIAQQNMIPLWYHEPDYHMQRLDPLTGWQRDADVYDAVVAHYLIKQFPNPSTVLTLNDHLNWTGTVTDVTQVDTTLLPIPSGALGMLKSVGNCSRASLGAAFKDFDRIRFNWNPVTAAYVDVSLQQDVNNKLDLRHTFAGQSGSGFVQTGSPGVSTDTVTEDISCDDTGSGGTATKFVTTVTGTTTANCSYRVTLLDAASAVIWQDVWSYTIGSDNTFSAHVPTTVSRVYQATTVRIEFTNLYLIGTDYGVQCITCDITVQTWINIDSHQQIVSNVQYGATMERDSGNLGNRTAPTIICPIPILTEGQTYVATVISAWMGTRTMDISGYMNTMSYTNLGGFITASGGNLTWYVAFEADDQTAIYGYGYSFVTVNVTISETVQDWLWSPSTFVWSDAFNLFESVDLPLSGFTRTGNPTNLTTIALTFAGDNYVDSLVLVADNPLPVTVRAGTGSRAYTVIDDFGSEAGAQAYADGLLPIVSVAREQYTRDVSLATDLSVGDTINGDGVNMTVYAVDYRQDGKTIAAGKSMDTLMTRLAEQARRLGTLERKGA